jgi:hypothetical protein
VKIKIEPAVVPSKASVQPEKKPKVLPKPELKRLQFPSAKRSRKIAEPMKPAGAPADPEFAGDLGK